MSDKKHRMDILANAMSAVYGFDTAEKMTVVDLIALSVIYQNPGITMTETTKLPVLKDVPLTTIQYSFVSFTKMDLIVKKPHPTDHKAKAIYLSAKGERLVTAITNQLKG